MKSTVRRAVVNAVLLGMLLPALGIGLYLATDYNHALDREIRTRLNHEADVVALGVRESLWALDNDSATALLDAVMQDSSIVTIDIRDPNLGHVVSRNLPERNTGQLHEIERAVMYRGEAIGHVHLVLSDSALRESLQQQLVRLISLLALQLVVSVLLILFVLQRRVGRPLQKLSAEAVMLARGELDRPIVSLRDDEIGNVETQLELTRQALQNLIHTLEQKNEALETDLGERRRVEAALRDREQRLSALVDQSPLAVIEFDLGWQILDWNAAAQHIFGWHAREIIGRDASVLHGSAQSEGMDLLSGHRQDARHMLTVKQECLRADGQSIVCHWYYGVIHDSAGAPERIMALVEDITVRQRTDDEVRRLATVVRLTSNLIALTDADGTIEWANQAFLRRFDSDGESVLQRKLADVLSVHHADNPAAPNPLIHDVIAGGRQLSGVELPCFGAGNMPLWAAVELRAIRGPDHGILQWAALLTDVTERRQTAEALRHSELKFFSIFQHSPIPICVLRQRDTCCLDVNPGFVGNFGFTRERLVGKPLLEARLHASEEDRLLLKNLLKASEASSGTAIRLLTAQGAARNCLLHLRPVTMDEEPCLLIAVVDVTSLVEARHEIEALNQSLEARVASRTQDLAASNAELASTLDKLKRTLDELVRSEKLAALGSLVAGIAHELNTPIGNSLMVASTLHDANRQFREQVANGLRRSTLDNYVEEAGSAADILMRNLQRAAELISSFKQVAVDQTSSQRREFDLGEVINEIVITMQPVLRKSQHRLLVEIPAGLRMDSYPGPLGQVIANLLNNSLLHAFDGREHGTIILKATPEGEKHLRLECRDDGVGITPANLKRVFDPFFTTRLGRDGTGLGLNIVHNIVTGMLGGEISVDSTLGQGTCFSVTLPRHAPETLREDDPETMDA
ncbi:PAS domain S-box protein [Uliginosibacterium paludis]|uniref:histidine kinase n=1 Tax=Uliginosibacterium paludis TaxID=1615952 RepID=A0ABV2CP15_9RHOO